MLELVKGKRIRIEGDGENAQVVVKDDLGDIEQLQREADLSYSKDEEPENEAGGEKV